MLNETIQNIHNRFSADVFTPNTPITDAQITHLVECASHAPSSYNMQHWRFIAVRSADKKTQLMNCAYGQQKIVDSSVAFIVLGDVDGYKELPAAFAPLRDLGYISQEIIDSMAQTVTNKYGTNPQAARDEAVRSASLAAMTLMLAAQSLGFISCPMSGFDAQKVSETFNLPANLVPVMLISLGKGEQKPKKPRFGTDKILTII